VGTVPIFGSTCLSTCFYPRVLLWNRAIARSGFHVDFGACHRTFKVYHISWPPTGPQWWNSCQLMSKPIQRSIDIVRTRPGKRLQKTMENHQHFLWVIHGKIHASPQKFRVSDCHRSKSKGMHHPHPNVIRCSIYIYYIIIYLYIKYYHYYY